MRSKRYTFHKNISLFTNPFSHKKHLTSPLRHISPSSFLIKPYIILPMESISFISKVVLSLEINPKSQLNRIKVSSSVNEPNEMYRNCMNSFLPFLADPSAMLTGTETAALRIYDVNPNFSSAGKVFVVS